MSELSGGTPHHPSLEEGPQVNQAAHTQKCQRDNDPWVESRKKKILKIFIKQEVKHNRINTKI